MNDNKNSYYENLTIIYTFLLKALVCEKKVREDGYVSEAMNVIESILKNGVEK